MYYTFAVQFPQPLRAACGIQDNEIPKIPSRIRMVEHNTVFNKVILVQNIGYTNENTSLSWPTSTERTTTSK
ncbi:BTE_HP_G0020430.mRNA.1.CDS.1 [Saccharomyces cerevisiae]|nr:BTE_HP_G0020430.mRNA.1.CDS.1 [Saccharomyces cerevisiae]CAI6602236.1 BTE_HP_G0020430.mRNA.1.CDS.1 [Saccharomyces cerevisiae]